MYEDVKGLLINLLILLTQHHAGYLLKALHSCYHILAFGREVINSFRKTIEKLYPAGNMIG
ncbi:hypothetical protein C2I06_05225 [Niallia circulans]|nr:hypothetical protein C2I06_05225 [Niallia circulans]